MSAPARLAAFAGAALLALLGGAAVGAAVGPIDDPTPAPSHSTPAHTTPTTAAAHDGHVETSAGTGP